MTRVERIEKFLADNPGVEESMNAGRFTEQFMIDLKEIMEFPDVYLIINFKEKYFPELIRHPKI